MAVPHHQVNALVNGDEEAAIIGNLALHNARSNILSIGGSIQRGDVITGSLIMASILLRWENIRNNAMPIASSAISIKATKP